MIFVFCGLLVLSLASPNECKKAYENELVDLVDLLSGSSSNLGPVLRFFYSGKDINDLGHYDACIARSDSRYLALYVIVLDSLPASLGLCVPKACDVASFQSLLGPTNFKVFVIEPHTDSMKAGGIFTMLLFSFLVVLVLLGTFVDFIGNTGILSRFSVQRSLGALLAKPVNDNTKILDGVRVMSMGWVILGHVYLARLFTPVINLEMLPEIFGYLSTMFSYGGFYAVDAFFWMSGFLLGYLLLTNSHRKPYYPWGLAIIMRIIRLLPVYICCILFVETVMPYIGSGPNWILPTTVGGDCSKYWWTNLLFINNIYPDVTIDTCAIPSWYLACDMQFFLFGILLLIAYRNYPPLFTWVGVAIVCLFSAIYSVILMREKDLYISIFANGGKVDEYFFTYSNPLYRCTPYVVGVLSGIVYFAYRSGSHEDKISKSIANWILNSAFVGYAMFFVGWALFTGLILIQLPCYKDKDNEFKGYSDNFNYFFLGTERLFVGIAFTLLFLPILLGHIGLVQRILSLNIWAPLSKLTFSTYLFHLFFIAIGLGSETYGYNYSVLSISLDFIFYLVISMVGGLVIYLLVEAPFSSFLKNKDKKSLSTRNLLSKN